jgi:hypothetical protein
MTAPVVRAADIALFLRDNPGWLAENAHLYEVLDPPVRLHGEALTDHMAAMLAAARAQAANEARRTQDVLSSRRQAASLAARVQDAVLALIRSPDPLDWLTDHLPSLLGLDAAHLCAEPTVPGAALLQPGTVAALLGGSAALVRHGAAPSPELHEEACGLARADALVRVPLSGPPALLALAARNQAALPREGEPALVFLGQALAAALQR